MEDDNAWDFPDDSTDVRVTDDEDDELYDAALYKENDDSSYPTYYDSYFDSPDYKYDSICSGNTICSDLDNCLEEGKS